MNTFTEEPQNEHMIDPVPIFQLTMVPIGLLVAHEAILKGNDKPLVIPKWSGTTLKALILGSPVPMNTFTEEPQIEPILKPLPIHFNW